MPVSRLPDRLISVFQFPVGIGVDVSELAQLVGNVNAVLGLLCQVHLKCVVKIRKRDSTHELLTLGVGKGLKHRERQKERTCPLTSLSARAADSASR